MAETKEWERADGEAAGAAARAEDEAAAGAAADAAVPAADDAADDSGPAADAAEDAANGAADRPGDGGAEFEPLDDEALNDMIEQICHSKAEEFQMLGYESVTGKDVWDCVSSKYKELPLLHKLVNDILTLKATDLMNWMTMRMWKQSERGSRRDP